MGQGEPIKSNSLKNNITTLIKKIFIHSYQKLLRISICNRSWRFWQSMASNNEKKQQKICIKRNVQSAYNRSSQ